MEPRNTLSELYILSGYGLAAGYGFVEVEAGTPARNHLAQLDGAARTKGLLVTPATAGPLPASGASPNLLHPPGMSLLAAALHRLTGLAADIPMEIFGALLDSLAAMLFAWLVTALFTAKLGRSLGYLYGLFPPLAFSATIGLAPEGLTGFFVAASLCCVVRGARDASPRAWAWYALSGVVTGVGCYLRPDYLFMSIFLVPAVAILGHNWRRALAAMLLAQVTALCLLAPWALRNHELTGRWIFTSTAIGCTLIAGIGEFHNPWNYGYADEDTIAFTARAGIHGQSTSEADVYCRKIYWQNLQEHPDAIALAAVRRLPIAFLAPHSLGVVNRFKTKTFTQQAAAGKDRYQAILADPLYVLGAYADRLLMVLFSIACLFGLGLMYKHEKLHRRELFLLLSAHLYSIAAHAVIHVEPRYLLPSFFVYLLGLAWWWNSRKSPAVKVT